MNSFFLLYYGFFFVCAWKIDSGDNIDALSFDRERQAIQMHSHPMLAASSISLKMLMQEIGKSTTMQRMEIRTG